MRCQQTAQGGSHRSAVHCPCPDVCAVPPFVSRAFVIIAPRTFIILGPAPRIQAHARGRSRKPPPAIPIAWSKSRPPSSPYCKTMPTLAASRHRIHRKAFRRGGAGAAGRGRTQEPAGGVRGTWSSPGDTGRRQEGRRTGPCLRLPVTARRARLCGDAGRQASRLRRIACPTGSRGADGNEPDGLPPQKDRSRGHKQPKRGTSGCHCLFTCQALDVPRPKPFQATGRRAA